MNNDDTGGNNFNEYLQQLVAEACSYPAGGLKRQKKLNQIVRVVTNSGKLWQENTPYYHDALSQTWYYFCKNPEKYDPKIAGLTTWLNRYLRWRLQDLRQDQADWENLTRPIVQRDRDDIRTILIEDIEPAPPDIPPLLEEISDWAKTDFDGKLRNTIFRKRPEINAQVLILRRLPPDTPWDNIAARFKLNPAEAKDLPKFYSRRCLPLLRNFCLQQGYIE